MEELFVQVNLVIRGLLFAYLIYIFYDGVMDKGNPKIRVVKLTTLGLTSLLLVISSFLPQDDHGVRIVFTVATNFSIFAVILFLARVAKPKIARMYVLLNKCEELEAEVLRLSNVIQSSAVAEDNQAKKIKKSRRI
jgi:hypothetical protein